ncbi:hypothetical protein BDN72DRAFT_802941 [Pluteus cervinus]|uniref:Uncharacterized protein n=1 Tax=Pluteus cervinus TaxID=181527 RepID=A0ACD3ADI9_9AGAR|nr:hypothetical protein BDN72DRAFT_802941 [Pluteus cervinus]
MTSANRLFSVGCLEADTPFTVVLPKSEFDSEFSLHGTISDAKKGFISLEDAERIARNVFEKRASHLDFAAEDIASVNVCIGKCTRDILSLREKISGLISKIVNLCNELSNATSLLQQKAGQRDLCHYLLAPIRYIHQDLLEPIFMACLELMPTPKAVRSKPPLQIASVCYRWREIACSTPALWSRVFIDQTVPGSYDQAKLWLTRCRFPSLSLHVSFGISEERLADIIPPQSQVQIRRLELLASQTDSNMVLSTIMNGHGDELEEVVLKDHEYRREDLPVPHLKRLYLIREPASWTRNPPPQQLTILRITKEIHWEMLEVILVQCALLQKLLVSLAEYGSKPGPHLLGESRLKEAVRRPHITYLGLVNDCKEEELPWNLLSNFAFPSLDILEYYVDGPSRASADWLLSLPFFGQVKRLSLQLQFQVPRSVYNSIFHAARSVEELSIYFDVDPMPEIFQALVDLFQSSDSPRRLPNLKSIHFSTLDRLQPTFAEILRVGLTWTTTALSHSPTQPRPLFLAVHRWDQEVGHDEGGDGETKQLLETLRNECPNLEPRFHRHLLSNWVYNVPILFEMYPMTFNEVRKYEVMDEAGTWTPKTGPMYSVG